MTHHLNSVEKTGTYTTGARALTATSPVTVLIDAGLYRGCVYRVEGRSPSVDQLNFGDAVCDVLVTKVFALP